MTILEILSDNDLLRMLDDRTPWSVRMGNLGIVVPDLRSALTLAQSQRICKIEELSVQHLNHNDFVVEWKQLGRLWKLMAN
jgi:hypothetical protein